jgi:ADP-heptose:LPS heptosyltransferase
MGTFVRSRKEYNNKGIPRDTFYEEKNNKVYSHFSPLPDGFKHTLPIIPPTRRRPQECGRNLQDQQDLAHASEQEHIIPRPFAVVVERGNTQGSLSIEQTTAIVKCLTDKGYHILLNGDKQRLASVLDNSTFNNIIDGKEFSFPEYTWLVNECSLVVTVNTSIYHFALQLQKPCVVISANEYETIKLDAPNQKIVFNEELQEAFEKGNLMSYKKNNAKKLDDIECNRIVAACLSLS